jgi:ribonuclease BN (tRNA processing enzyme)
MFITCGGVRGSAPIHHPDFLAFGGDTTAFRIAAPGAEPLLLDLGSGVRGLLPGLLGSTPPDLRVTVLLTHFHLDHLLGLPHLAAVLPAGATVEVYAPDHLPSTAREAVERLLAPPLWPLRLEDYPAHWVFHSLVLRGGTVTLSRPGWRITACPTPHPGQATAYRIEAASGAAAVIAPDLEWAAGDASQRDAFLRLCASPRPADLLLMDGQFDPEDYPARAGWGHSTWREAAEVARHAGVPRLAVIHHDPSHPDTALRSREARLQREAPGAVLARQGDVLAVTPP